MGSGGNFVMQMAPKVKKKCIILGDQIFVPTKNTYDCAFLSKVVTATDEDELAARIRKAEEENASALTVNAIVEEILNSPTNSGGNTPNSNTD